MNIGQYIKNNLKSEGRSIRWLSKQLNINEYTLNGKINRNSITAEELLKIGKILDWDLNKLRDEIEV